MRRIVLTATLAAALLLVPVAIAATPGKYEGWLHKASGERWKGSFAIMTVRDTSRGQRFRLSVYNMRLGCPYLDRNGNQVKARFRFIFRDGRVQGDYVDDARRFPADGPATHRIRVWGQFTGRRFAGRVRVSSARGVAGACTGSARLRLTR